MIAKYDKSQDKLLHKPYFTITDSTAFSFKKNDRIIGLVHLSNSAVTGQLKENLMWMGLHPKETGIPIDTFEIFESYRGHGYGKEMVNALFDYYPESTFIAAYANAECLTFWEQIPGYVFETEDEGYYHFYIYKETQ